MRRILLAVSAAALITGPFVLGSNRAEAMVTASQLDRAEQSIDPIEKAGCWRWGWRGWGWYPCGYYGGPGWGPYHRWGWGHRWGGWGWHHRW
jgi:hypothetical protein